MLANINHGLADSVTLTLLVVFSGGISGLPGWISPIARNRVPL